MIHIDLTIAITLMIAVFSFLAYLANVLAKGVSCLTSLKKDVEAIRNNQTEIVKDIEKMQDHIYNREILRYKKEV